MNTKLCPLCNRQLPLSSFGVVKKGSTKPRSYCRECDVKKVRQYRKDHPEWRKKAAVGDKKYYDRKRLDPAWREKERLRKKVERQEKQKMIYDYLLEHPCADCNESNLIVLEFDHRNPDDKEFDVAKAAKLSYAKERIKKEIEKCDVRCGNCHRKTTMIRKEQKSRTNGKCIDCGDTDPYHLIGGDDAPICVNCYKKRTAEQDQWLRLDHTPV